MKQWTPLDILILVITTAVILVLITAMIDTLLTDIVSESTADRIENIMMTLLAIVSMYVGAQIQKYKEK